MFEEPHLWCFEWISEVQISKYTRLRAGRNAYYSRKKYAKFHVKLSPTGVVMA